VAEIQWQLSFQRVDSSRYDSEGLRHWSDGSWCALRLQAHTLRFSFDSGAVPVLGLWFNNFRFPSESARPFQCIAVEPCTSPTDSLDALDVAAETCQRLRCPMRLSISANDSGESE
jgi:hypothetical protein